MCGIAGVFRAEERADDLNTVRGMMEPLRSRGPDGEGLIHEGPLTVGHKRLAIIDLSEAAAQPMESAGGRFLVSFNGEIYNYRELAREIAIPAGVLRTSSDTEILLFAWERWGPSCLDKLVGQWAFAMYDRREERLWLVRDRFGEKPLFFHEHGRCLTFASSLESLLRAPWVPRELCQDALDEYLTLRYVVSPRTVLRDVRKVPPGHYLVADRHGSEQVGWWSPRFKNRPRSAFPSRREAEETFGARLVEASRRCLVSDVPVGLLLSDGIDSNGVLAALREGGLTCPTYTYRTSGHAAGLRDDSPPRPDPLFPSTLIRVSYEETLEDLEPAFSSLTEPVGDGTVMATYHLIRQARTRSTVFLAGHGGDEVLGGYRLSQDRSRLAAMRILCRLPFALLDKMIDCYTNGEASTEERRRALVQAAPMRAPEAALHLTQHPLPPSELGALFAPQNHPGRYLGVIERLYKECDAHATDLDRMQEVAMRTFLSEHMLTVADSTAMACSAEARLPFLDRDLADFVFHLPPTMRVSRWPGLANTKRVLRWWARGRVVDDVITRKKSGFRHGGIRSLLAVRGPSVRSMILDSKALRRHIGGLEAWISRPHAIYRRGLEGTYWAILALALWGDRNGIT